MWGSLWPFRPDGLPVFSRLYPPKNSFVAKNMEGPVVTRDDVSMSASPAFGDRGSILNSQPASATQDHISKISLIIRRQLCGKIFRSQAFFFF